jgi:molybdopterin-guanine dinucleotide biosynthesis protein A
MPSETQNHKVEGFILAGGKSSRMGKNKAFLSFGAETFLEHAVRVLSPICDGRVKIVLNPNQSESDFHFLNCVRDIFVERGALGGIHAAVANSKSEWTAVLACDLPLVTSETISGLYKFALEASNDIAAIVPRQADGRFQPLCAFYRTNLCLPQLEKLLQTETSSSVKDFLELIPTIYVEENQMSGDKESVFFNVNTPAEYELLNQIK